MHAVLRQGRIEQRPDAGPLHALQVDDLEEIVDLEGCESRSLDPSTIVPSSLLACALTHRSTERGVLGVHRH